MRADGWSKRGNDDAAPLPKKRASRERTGPFLFAEEADMSKNEKVSEIEESLRRIHAFLYAYEEALRKRDKTRHSLTTREKQIASRAMKKLPGKPFAGLDAVLARSGPAPIEKGRK